MVVVLFHQHHCKMQSSASFQYLPIIHTILIFELPPREYELDCVYQLPSNLATNKLMVTVRLLLLDLSSLLIVVLEVHLIEIC